MIKLEVQAARLAKDADARARSATIVLRSVGYLRVRLFFLGRPMEGLGVEFFHATPEGEAGESMGDAVKTDTSGIAGFTHALPAGLYVCQIEHQAPAQVTTVEDPDRPFPIVLPVSRPYVDIGGDVGFTEDDPSPDSHASS